MKFELDLNEELMLKYARHLEYEENELSSINENIMFKDTLTNIIENSIDTLLYNLERR